MISKKRARECAAASAEAVWKLMATTKEPWTALLGEGMGVATVGALIETQPQLTTRDIYGQCTKRDPQALSWEEVGAPMRVTLEIYRGCLLSLMVLVADAERARREMEAGRTPPVILPDRGAWRRAIKRRDGRMQRVDAGERRIDPDAYLAREHVTPPKDGN